MTTEHGDHPTTKSHEEDLPFLDQLVENPLQFSLGNVLPAVSDEATKEDTPPMKQQKSFCNNNMMMMGGHPMLQHGAGVLPLGGGMMGGMVMYMDGFRFALTGNQPCLNLFFHSWTLDTRWKFLGAMMLVFTLAFSTEAVSKFRHKLSSSRPASPEFHARRILISGLHAAQALLGYIVMLAAMTFSVELMLCVILGLSSGYCFFFAGEVGLEGHVTTNPCCNFMQDENDERRQQEQQQVALVANGHPQPLCCDDSTFLLADGGEKQPLLDFATMADI